MQHVRISPELARKPRFGVAVSDMISVGPTALTVSVTGYGCAPFHQGLVAPPSLYPPKWRL
eukprot:15344182-Alexandrium_andersonii.AAC.1